LKLTSDTKLVASVHDEVVLEVPVQESERAERLLKQVMTVGMEKLLKTVPVVVEVTVSCFWEK
jgi:DNA polymerase-1